MLLESILVLPLDICRNELSELSRQQAINKKAERDHLAEKNLEEYSRHHHHLVSTVVLPGVYNSPFQVCVMQMIRCLLRYVSIDLNTLRLRGCVGGYRTKQYCLKRLSTVQVFGFNLKL